MSRFFSTKYSSLSAYVPGEQPKERKYVKLNTNESPFPPSPSVSEAVLLEASRLNLYSDPECTPLVKIFSERYGVSEDMVIMTNGSESYDNRKMPTNGRRARGQNAPATPCTARGGSRL